MVFRFLVGVNVSQNQLSSCSLKWWAESNSISLWFCHKWKPWMWLRPLSAQTHCSWNTLVLRKHFRLETAFKKQLSCCLQAENSSTEELGSFPFFFLFFKIKTNNIFKQHCSVRILRLCRYDYITHKNTALASCGTEDWLKDSLLTHQCMYGKAPTYLKEQLVTQTFSRTLCSGMVPRTNCTALVMEPSAQLPWNALPDHLRAPQTVDSFKMSQNIFPPRLSLCL